MSHRHDDEFEELLSKVSDGELGKEDRLRLSRFLIGDKARKQRYFDWISTHVLLESEAALRAEVEQLPVAVPAAASQRRSGRSGATARGRQPRRTPHRLLAGYAIAAAVGAIAIGWGLYQGERNAPPLMATVVDAIDVVGGPLELTQEGAIVDIGLPLEYAEGIVAMKMPSGVEFTLQGPASLIVQGSNRVRLDQGRLYAKVPPEGVGFAVETPAAELVDLGTEFGVICGLRGSTSAYVYKGAVSVESANQAETLRIGTKVTALPGAGLGPVRDFRPQDEDLFTRSVDGSDYLRALERLDPLYVHRFSSNSKLRTFGSSIERDQSTVSLSGGVYASAGGPIATPNSSDGCLLFVGVESNTIVDSIGSSLSLTEAYTIVAWARVSEPGPQGLVAFTSDRGTDVDLGPIVRLTQGGFLEHRCHLQGEPDSYVGQRSSEQVPRQEWVMIAASGGSNRKLHLYLNGRSVSEPIAVPASIRADCGQLALGSGSGRSLNAEIHTGPLRGAIDEVAVFDYELSEKELRRLFRIASLSMPARSN